MPVKNIFKNRILSVSDISRLTPIKEQLPDYIEFNHIKLVIAVLQWRYGMTDTHLHNESESQDAAPSGGGFAGQAAPTFTHKPQMTGSSSFKSKSASDGQSIKPCPAQEAAGGQKRKLPPWMFKGMAKQGSLKKQKKNSLFR